MRGKTYTMRLSPALRQLLINCRIYCTVDCCRERAFEINGETVQRWLAGERIDRKQSIYEEIRRLKVELETKQGSIFLSARDLESDWHADAFRKFMTNLESAFIKAVKDL